MINGIDVSNWQGEVDFSQVKNAGYEIVYIKATEGEHTPDAFFEVNYANAKANGMKIGVYHFLQGNESGVDQANFLYSRIKDKEIDCKIAIDVEVTNGANADTLSQIVCDFADTITSLTKMNVVLYTYTSFLTNNLNNTINKYPLWIAEYGVSNPSVNNYIGWQYSENGTVAGCPNGNTDLDYFTEDIFLSKVSSSSTLNPTFRLGEEVIITGDYYATGQLIPSWVRQNTYPIIQIGEGKVLLGNGLDSWVNDSGVEIKKQYNFYMGQNVRIIANNYSTGQEIPAWVKQNVYPIIQIDTNKCLLGNGLDSWVNKDGLLPA